ncbi:16S rRNA (adenine(1518)-N(6)/adenine(1519)-N(6))-dimethyltransferase RsmA [Candidatus Parabeggiatoa sp. HSG14]|uniref:16S rRNA (adenine(1518)-N(6)/adenine(1519)-N(6))- dimethyltransferase RsmA n=1 Tax=Candidatus Parabeggiatoa sp. HSG14 TaxID=3055593 RepID=UPI0025A71AC8|nr:16S rRNA (adenine(1518)-N(6)/adenine(1519)-N(6))-dimethyltransferase RsmA [Thiotrichales bacterium HSG14]
MKTSHSPRKRFSQHFLQDDHIIQRIITTIAPKPEQHLVELGPGKGALTMPLLQYDCLLDVIELDRDLIEWLKQKTLSFKQLRIHNADVLKFDFKQLVGDEKPLRVVGNLPYNISTPLLFHLVNYTNIIQDMVFMLQKEVVDRMVAIPATSDYGRLSVMLQYHFQIEKLFDVESTAFYPSPKIMSSVVQLIPYFAPPVKISNQKHFSQVVAQAFSQRRKTLRNTLKGLLDNEEIKTAGIEPQVRAETLTLTEFARLSNELTLNKD